MILVWHLDIAFTIESSFFRLLTNQYIWYFKSQIWHYVTEVTLTILLHLSFSIKDIFPEIFDLYKNYCLVIFFSCKLEWYCLFAFLRKLSLGYLCLLSALFIIHLQIKFMLTSIEYILVYWVLILLMASRYPSVRSPLYLGLNSQYSWF